MREQLRQYLIITGNYWAFTLTDGALRMLVVLYFHQLGYSPLDIALLFLFYEFFGVVTNLVGGWLGARLGLNRTMNIGLMLQVIALSMLLVPTSLLSVAWVMAAQALSGIAKDLNKMSAKSAIKYLVPENAEGTLFKWVAILTGSKNTLKGVGFFLGGVLLTTLGFQGAVLSLAIMLAMVFVFSLFTLQSGFGKAKSKPKFTELFSKSASVNKLSAARLFLFAARDVWFVVALPVTLASTFGWDHWRVGGFLAIWIILYGIVQTQVPRITGTRITGTRTIGARSMKDKQVKQKSPDGMDAFIWAALLSLSPALIALFLGGESFGGEVFRGGSFEEAVFNQTQTLIFLIVGLLIFGILFAINSSLHSYLIVSYADSEKVSMDVGFYYMANAGGRLMGTVLSGWIYQLYGISACLWISSLFLVIAALLSLSLPRKKWPHQR